MHRQYRHDTQKPSTPHEVPSIPISNENLVIPVPNETPGAPIPNSTPSIPFLNETTENPVKSKIVDVSIKDFTFNPNEATISAGDTVKWTNLDSNTHTVKGPGFESDTLREGDSYAFIFSKSGIYNYECSIHPSMKGTVTVI
jgi:plastocyanin